MQYAYNLGCNGQGAVNEPLLQQLLLTTSSRGGERERARGPTRSLLGRHRGVGLGPTATSPSWLPLCLHCAELPRALVADCRVRWRRGGIHVFSHHVCLCFFLQFYQELGGREERRFSWGFKDKKVRGYSSQCKNSRGGMVWDNFRGAAASWEGCGEPRCSELAVTEPAGPRHTGHGDTSPLRGVLGGEEEGQESERGKNFIPGDDRGKWVALYKLGGG